MYNASRIWKLYGTRSQKGTATACLPWRWSRVIEDTQFAAPGCEATQEQIQCNTEAVRRVSARMQAQRKVARKALTQSRASDPGVGRDVRYVQVAMDAELRNLRGASQGERNIQLNKSAFALGQLVGGGLVDRLRVEQELWQAAREIGLEDSEIQATMRSGIEAGMKEPRRRPENPKSNTPPGESPKNRGTGTSECDPVHLTDRGLAIRVVQAQEQNLRYCHPWKKWVVWDGFRWREDVAGGSTQAVKKTIVAIFREEKKEIECIEQSLADQFEEATATA